MRIATTLVLVSVLVCSACSERKSEYPPPKLRPDDAIGVAVDFLKQQDVSVSDYEVNYVVFNYTDRTWRISYSGKSGILHDDYWLKISDEGGNEVTLLDL